jgi:hypothetical protein
VKSESVNFNIDILEMSSGCKSYRHLCFSLRNAFHFYSFLTRNVCHERNPIRVGEVVAVCATACFSSEITWWISIKFLVGDQQKHCVMNLIMVLQGGLKAVERVVNIVY